MCMFCAAIPAAAAVGAKLNANQLHKDRSERLPIPKLTALAIGLLVISSAIYHALAWRE
jgi:hypothetical protein